MAKINFKRAAKVGGKIFLAGIIPGIVIVLLQALLIPLIANDPSMWVLALIWSPIAIAISILGTGYFAAKWWKYS